MIKKLRLHNFKTFLNFEIDLTRRHLLIGKNNSGKTNLCLAMKFLGATASTELLPAVGLWGAGGISSLRNWGSKSNKTDLSLTCELPFGQERLSFKYDLSLEIGSAFASVPGTSTLRVVNEQLVVDGGQFQGERLLDNNGHEAFLLHEEQVGKINDPHRPKTLSPPNATMLSKLNELETNQRAILFRKYLTSWAYYSLSPRQMRFGWREAAQGMALGPYAENLAVAIFHLKNRDERRYRRLIERIKPFEDGLDAINFLVAPDQGIVPFVALRQSAEASWEGFSDGTLRALAMSCIIEQADLISSQEGSFAPFFLIEEPENGIHGNLLRKLLEEFENCAPEAQFVFTSHSPYFIDLFDSEPASVTLLRRENERTVAQRLSPDKKSPPDERLSLSEKYFAEMLG